MVGDTLPRCGGCGDVGGGGKSERRKDKSFWIRDEGPRIGVPWSEGVL